jgi:hypothetical protein
VICESFGLGAVKGYGPQRRLYRVSLEARIKVLLVFFWGLLLVYMYDSNEWINLAFIEYALRFGWCICFGKGMWR